MNSLIDKYLGIPHVFNGRGQEGVDCIGLIELFFKQELKVQMPDDYCKGIRCQSTEEWKSSDTFKDEYRKEIMAGAEKLNALELSDVNELEYGDVLIFGCMENLYFIGIYIGKGRALTTNEIIGSTHIVRLTDKYKKRFILGYRVAKNGN